MQRNSFLSRKSERRASADVPQSGFTLVEVLLALSAISALSILTITVICLLISAEQQAAESLFIDVTVANLAADLREDAHQATGIEVAQSIDDGRAAQVTLIQSDGARVTYACNSEGVTRRREQPGLVVMAESYRLAFGTSWFEPPGETGVLTWNHEREIPNIGGFSEASAVESYPLRRYSLNAAIGLHAAIAGGTE